jgi:hypothetical protein
VRTSILSIMMNSARAGAKHQGSDAIAWTRPAPHQVKVNVDAAYHEDEHAGAIGVVLRDYQGNFLAQKVVIFHMCTQQLWLNLSR